MNIFSKLYKDITDSTARAKLKEAFNVDDKKLNDLKLTDNNVDSSVNVTKSETNTTQSDNKVENIVKRDSA